MIYTQPIPTRKPSTTKGAPVPQFEREDWDMLLRFKATLAGYTATAGQDYAGLAAKVGLTGTFITHAMHTDFTNLVSRTQLWAQVFDLRVNFMLTIGHESVQSPEMQMMEQFTVTAANHKWQRMYLNERLVDVRTNLRLSDEEFGAKMGIGAEAARELESKHDWLMPHVFRRVRALGGVLELQLV